MIMSSLRVKVTYMEIVQGDEKVYSRYDLAEGSAFLSETILDPPIVITHRRV